MTGADYEPRSWSAVIVGSLFTGAGLLDLGLQQAGIRHAWFIERDEWRQRLIRQRWPGVPVHDDVRTATVRLTDEQFARAKAEYEAGASLAAIAEELPCTRQALWERMKRAGVDMRPQQRHGADNHFYRGGEYGADWAHNKVEKAVMRGDLIRPDACEECGGTGPEYADGRTAIQAHHDDYNEPLVVRWLCQPCHHEWHKHNRAVPLAHEGDVESSGGDAQGSLFELAPVDAIVGGFPQRHARAPRARGSGLVSLILRLRCGPSSLESFASFGPDSCWWRTWPQSSLFTGARSGERFSGTWPRSGMTWRGTAYPLVPSAPRTAATASSLLLPTPHGFAKEGQDRKPGPTGNELGRALTLLPTPAAGLHNYDEDPEQFEARRERLKAKGINGNGAGTPPPIALKLLPTPTEGDSRNGRNATANSGKGSTGHSGTTLSDVAYEWSGASTSPPSPDGNTSTAPRLNPSFVEWMIGTPRCGECGRDWTDSDCPHSATAYTSTSPGSSEKR